MKQSTSSTHFGGIPLDTNTLAGQWMTFSHMANHYRKLLNVKPRVDTGLMVGCGGSSGNLSINSKMIQSSKSGKKKKNSTNNCTTANSTIYNNNHQQQQQQHRGHRDNLMYSSHPDHLNISAGGGGDKNKPLSAMDNNHIELTIKSPLKNGRSKKNALTSHYPEYQVVFGPASLQSSSDGDAFMSDETGSILSNHHNDNSKPPSEVQAPIGVTEKIRRFLSHIHQLDLTSKPTSPTTKPTSSKKSVKRATTALTPTTAERPVTVNSAAAVTKTSSRCDRQTRHSKCFLPWEPPSPKKSPRKCVSSAIPQTSSGKNGDTPRVIIEHQQLSKSDHHFDHHHHHHYHQLSPRLTRNKFTGSGGNMHTMIPEKDFSSSRNKRPGKSRRRAESVASIGTICGSEELTAEDFPVTIKDICSTLENSLMAGNDDLLQSIMLGDNPHRKHNKKSPRKVLHEQHHNKNTRTSQKLVKSNSMASLVPSSSGASGNTHVIFAKSDHRHAHHHHQEGVAAAGNVAGAHATNKDSSRDSAYGFSSGESRITTRESTPEKKCLTDGFNLSRNKGHVGFEDKPCKDIHQSTDKQRLSKSSKENHRHRTKDREDHAGYEGLSRKVKATSTRDLRKHNSSDRYIAFLTEMTNDIVRKGIYTNKGLKTLFKSHVEQNKELNPKKLADMVERLRMDLGIPKDDTLDKIEFGYGSVSDTSTTAFFYTPSTPTRDKLSTESVLLSAKTAVSSSRTLIPSTIGDLYQIPSQDDPPSSHPSSPSPTTIIPTIPMPPDEMMIATAGTSTTTGFSSSGGPNTSSNRSSTTGEGSGVGDLISVPDSEDNFTGKRDDDDDFEEDVEEDEIDNGQSNDEEVVEDLSLSETEVSEYLKVVGLDNGTMQSVMGILKS